MKPTHESDGIPEIEPDIPENAVRLYGQSDAMDDFPVLKAFQQYIDAEQAKARKRMLILCVFFGALMSVVIAVFLVLLLNVSSRNQSLNDRLFEYAMKERERMSSPIVVQPPQQQQDNSILLSLTAKLEDMQKRLDESRKKAEESRRQVEIETVKPKGPTPEELEIKRLNALLAAEKEKQAAEKARQAAEKEKERQHQLKIEAYRRKYYPEFYEKEKSPMKPPRSTSAHDELMQEINKILEDDDAITYYDEQEPAEKISSPRRAKKTAPAPVPASQKEYSIPVDIRGSSSRWSVPNE